MTSFPSFPMSGKGGKVYLASGDGLALVLAAMTIQASKKYRGKTYENLIYLLGAGKTLLNMRPEMAPVIDIDGILQGLEISVGEADKAAVSGGIIEADGVQVVVTANPAVSLTRPAASKCCWNGIIVNKTTGVITAIAGTDTATVDPDELLDTYGAEAGQRPLTPVDSLLVGWVKLVDSTPAVISGSDIDYQDRENSGVSYEILPNLGGVKLEDVLPLMHVGPARREVKFTGRYLDTVMALVPSAKDWNLNTESNETSEDTMSGTYSSSTPKGQKYSYNQLASDRKAIDAYFEREGYGAIRLMYPNGFYWQSVATFTPSMANNVNSMSSIAVSGMLLDFPAEG